MTRSMPIEHITVDDSQALMVFGGPYSNLQAAQAMKAEAERLGIPPSNVICTGDIVAYCAHPHETAQLIRDWGIHSVQGNCEYALGNDAASCGCGFKADSACDLASKQWFEYSRKHLDNEMRGWMQRLPYAIRFSYEQRDVVCLHGSINDQSEFIFASTPITRKEAILKELDTDIVIGGHCGLPFGVELSNKRAWLNAGVIGMPANDGNANTWYMLIEAHGDKLTASWHRLNYDHLAAQSAMATQIPSSPYTNALSNGLWPNMDILPETEKLQQGCVFKPAPLVL